MSGEARAQWTSIFAYLGFLASVVTLAWVGGLIFVGVHLSYCPYFVPVVHHPGVLACFDHPRPIHVP